MCTVFETKPHIWLSYIIGYTVISPVEIPPYTEAVPLALKPKVYAGPSMSREVRRLKETASPTASYDMSPAEILPYAEALPPALTPKVYAGPSTSRGVRRLSETPSSTASHDMPSTSQPTSAIIVSASSGARAIIRCSVCERAFSFMSQFKLHAVIHTGEKLFKCPLCPAVSFNRATILKRHTESKRHKQREVAEGRQEK